MDDQLRERLNILEQAGMMKEPIKEVVGQLAQKLEAVPVELTDQAVGMFFTHLVTALNRQLAGQALNEVNQQMVDELTQTKQYEQTKPYVELIESAIKQSLELAERLYIESHLCVLLANEK